MMKLKVYTEEELRHAERQYERWEHWKPLLVLLWSLLLALWAWWIAP